MQILGLLFEFWDIPPIANFWVLFLCHCWVCCPFVTPSWRQHIPCIIKDYLMSNIWCPRNLSHASRKIEKILSKTFAVLIQSKQPMQLHNNSCLLPPTLKSRVYSLFICILIYKVIYHFVYFSFDYVQPFGYLCSILFLYMIFCIRYDFVPYQYSQ